MSSSGIVAGRRSIPSPRRPRWHPVSVAPPEQCTAIWVYCPRYPHPKVRPSDATLLEYCSGATHWIERRAEEPAPLSPSSRRG